MASGARVGKFLGMGDGAEARRAAWSAVCAVALVSGGLGSFLMFSDHDFVPFLFTDARDVVQETAKTIPLLSAYVFADGCQVTLSGVLKGCGLQRWAAPGENARGANIGVRSEATMQSEYPGDLLYFALLVANTSLRSSLPKSLWLVTGALPYRWGTG